MGWLLLSIITNTALLLIIKAFSRFGVNTLHGIVVNYITAGLTGILMAGIPFPLAEAAQQEWSWMPPVLGTLFFSVFMLIAFSTQTIGVSTTTVAYKMSVVIPVAVALIFYKEPFGIIRVIGMVLTLIALYLTTRPAKKRK
jgi:drug/metabolite transporter (DMT)-like permease